MVRRLPCVDHIGVWWEVQTMLQDNYGKVCVDLVGGEWHMTFNRLSGARLWKVGWEQSGFYLVESYSAISKEIYRKKKKTFK
jgi:hypothetical protein